MTDKVTATAVAVKEKPVSQPVLTEEERRRLTRLFDIFAKVDKRNKKKNAEQV